MVVSNNLLAGLVIVAIIISVAGAMVTLSMIGQIPILTGMTVAGGTANATIAQSVIISLPVSTTDFGSMLPNDVNDTEDESPVPLELKNEGTVKINITVNATALWTGTLGSGTTSYFQFNSTENETGTVTNVTEDLTTTWTDMPIAATAVFFATNVDFDDPNDSIEAEIRLEVPDDEPAGDKSSTITFTSTPA